MIYLGQCSVKYVVMLCNKHFGIKLPSLCVFTYFECVYNPWVYYGRRI